MKTKTATNTTAFAATIANKATALKVNDLKPYELGAKPAESKHGIVISGNRVLIITHWSDVDWTLARECRSYKYPTVTHYTTATLYSAAGKKLKRQFIDRRGDILAKALKALDLPTAKRTALTLSEGIVATRMGVKGKAEVFALRCSAAAKNSEPLAFAARRDGIIYHANSVKAAVEGVIEKIRKVRDAEMARDNQILTPDYCAEKWGFCFVGMGTFCELLGLENPRITFADLREMVATAIKNGVDISAYKQELRTMGMTF